MPVFTAVSVALHQFDESKNRHDVHCMWFTNLYNFCLYLIIMLTTLEEKKTLT